MVILPTRLGIHALYPLFFLLFSFFFAQSVFAKTLMLYADPPYGIAPLDVKLTCSVDPTTEAPASYTIDFDDGTAPETVESTAYSYTFTHKYEGGFFRPRASVVKTTMGTLVDSDPIKLIVGKWKFETNDDVDSSPAVGPDGTVYVGSDDGNLYALEPVTGTELWRFQTGGEVQSSPAIGPDGVIYFGSNDKNLYALTPQGSLKWAYNINDHIFSSPAISADERMLYIGSSNNSLYAFNFNGSLKWKFDTGGKIISSPSIAHNGQENVVYFGSLDHHVYAVAARNGRLLWTFETKAGVYASPAIDSNGQIYVGECEVGDAEIYNFSLYCINVDGSKWWQYKGGEAGFYSSPAIGSDGIIYVGSWDGKLHAIDKRGVLRWSVTASYGADINSSPALGSNGVIYAGSKDGNFYAMQSPAIEDSDLDGWKREDWYFKTGDDIFTSSPAIDAEGTIYFGSRDNCVYAINPGNMNLDDSPWPMFQKSADHSGVAGEIILPPVISTVPVDNSVAKVDTAIQVNFSPDIKSTQINLESFTFHKILSDNELEQIQGHAIIKNNNRYNISAVFVRSNDEIPLDKDSAYMASILYASDNTEPEKFDTQFVWVFFTESASTTKNEENSGGDTDFLDIGCFINCISPHKPH